MDLFSGLELSPFQFACMAIGASVASGVGAVALGPWAARHGLLSRSRRDRFGTGRVPLTGGPGLLLGISAAVAFLRPPLPPGGIAAGLCFFLVGLLDDLRPLSPLRKMGAQSLVAIVAALLLTRSPAYAGFAVLILLLLVNASNYLDNMDGLLAGVALSQACALAFFALHAGAGSTLLLWALPGVFLLTLPPARLYLGDSGSHLIGALLAADSLELLSGPTGFRPHYLPAMAVLFAVPLADVATVTLSRLRRKRPIFRGGTDHLSHRLVRAGFSVPQAVAVLVVASAVCGAAALMLARSGAA